MLFFKAIEDGNKVYEFSDYEFTFGMIFTGIIIIIAFYLLYATMAKLIDTYYYDKELKQKEKEKQEDEETEEKN